jgi:hypothetical protein
LLCEKILVAKSKEVKTVHNLAESSKEGCGSKRDYFADDECVCRNKGAGNMNVHVFRIKKLQKCAC